MTSCAPNLLPSTHLLIPFHWLRASTYEFGGSGHAAHESTCHDTSSDVTVIGETQVISHWLEKPMVCWEIHFQGGESMNVRAGNVPSPSLGPWDPFQPPPCARRRELGGGGGGPLCTADSCCPGARRECADVSVRSRVPPADLDYPACVAAGARAPRTGRGLR